MWGRGRSRTQEGEHGGTEPNLVCKGPATKVWLKRPDSQSPAMWETRASDLMPSVWVPPSRRDVVRIRETMSASSSQLLGQNML